MNVLYKLFCRAYQAVFRALNPVLPYRQPQRLDRVEQVPEVLKKLSLDRVLLVTARRNMLTAAYKAGIAFSKSYVGYVHAVAHSLGGQYNIPHGLANAVLLPIVLEAYGHVVDKPLHDLAVATGLATGQDADSVAAARFLEAVQQLNRRLGIPETLSGIRAEDIPLMARHAAREANPLYPVPVLLDAGQLEQFYTRVAGEQERAA